MIRLDENLLNNLPALKRYVERELTERLVIHCAVMLPSTAYDTGCESVYDLLVLESLLMGEGHHVEGEPLGILGRLSEV